MRLTTPEEQDEISLRLLGRKGKFEAYFTLFDELALRESTFSCNYVSSSPTHQHVLSTAIMLRNNIQNTKEETVNQICHGDQTIGENVDNIINRAVQAMVMIDSAAQEWHPANFVLGGYRPISWLSRESFVSFVERSIPRAPDQSYKTFEDIIGQKSKLKAWKLKKRLGICFLPTNDLSCHLLFNEKGNTLYLFHQVAYLKAHLEQFQSHTSPLDITVLESLRRGTLPPQLLFETLHSLQDILFPLTDHRSEKILRALICRNGFDPECLEYDGYNVFHKGIRYVYWGERIARLYELAKKRPPRNKLERWFDRRSTDGNAFSIALLALCISILVGIVSILISGFQAWIAWMAWKYPAEVQA
ncbi:hypothetical protein QSH57_009914 [Fusarium oxysporum f. sp. vasinfectum]|nr:hypothetical protein QSH57_009914 [Fusarium oxysporum f. sp. vasinfectum]